MPTLPTINPENYNGLMQMWRAGTIRDEKWQFALMDPLFSQYVIDHPIETDLALVKNPAAPVVIGEQATAAPPE